jgi:hypothetical protein
MLYHQVIYFTHIGSHGQLTITNYEHYLNLVNLMVSTILLNFNSIFSLQQLANPDYYLFPTYPFLIDFLNRNLNIVKDFINFEQDHI